MLTDVFFRRYDSVTLWTAHTGLERTFLGQAAQLITDELLVRSKTRYKEEANDPASKAQEAAHYKLARELGRPYLVSPTFTHSWKAPNGNTMSQSFPRTADNKTVSYLTQQMAETSSPDRFVKNRISFIELAFQERASWLARERSELAANETAARAEALHVALGNRPWRERKRVELEQSEAALSGQIYELNERFRQARMPLCYHNNLIQISDDALLESILERPFWSLVAVPKWSVVDQQIKEALDQRDSGDRNAVSNALNALESTIKIISDDNGWTTGTERGAANYIDNLVKERAGARFLAVWERDSLIKLFGDIRNLFGHGPASGQPLPSLKPQQTDWVIDATMAWVKSLVRRA